MRVKGIFKPADYPGKPEEVAELFDSLFPGVENPQIGNDHAGLAIAAHNPRLALHLAGLSRFIIVETGWARRADLRELAFQTLNLHFKSDYSWQARLPHCAAAGIGEDLLAALPDWRNSDQFDEEQRLVIEYTQAVVSGDVPAALFSRVVERYGEKGVVEFTTLVAFWSAWAMIINAAQPEFGTRPPT